MRHKYLKLIVAALVVAGGVVVASSASNAAAERTSMAPTVSASGSRNPAKFWTWARVRKATPRDFVFDRSTGSFRSARRQKAMRLDMFTNLGASWTSGGAVATTTGRVFFALGTNYYSCSGTVVDDNGTSNRSVVVTAAHCAYDETRDIWATNWIFVPDYDSSPAAFTTSGSFCESTTYGCWSAKSLVVPKTFADQPSFNDTAVKHDYAFAVVSLGGTKNTHLDAEVGDQAIDFTTRDNEANTWIFGYPAQGKYRGNDLVYCKGLLGWDPALDWSTYRLPCRMTGGASGGPWFSPFVDSGQSVGTGTIFSVTSYSYGGSKALYGSIFGAETQQMLAVAFTIAPGNSLFQQP